MYRCQRRRLDMISSCPRLVALQMPALERSAHDDVDSGRSAARPRITFSAAPNDFIGASLSGDECLHFTPPLRHRLMFIIAFAASIIDQASSRPAHRAPRGSPADDSCRIRCSRQTRIDDYRLRAAASQAAAYYASRRFTKFRSQRSSAEGSHLAIIIYFS